MRFKLDKNLPVEASSLLREAGHDALTVLDQNMGGNADEYIIQICSREQRALITLYLDFADINTYPPANYHGILVLRIKRQSTEVRASIAVRSQHRLHGHSWSTFAVGAAGWC